MAPAGAPGSGEAPKAAEHLESLLEHPLSREAVESPSLEGFKKRIDVALWDVV